MERCLLFFLLIPFSVSDDEICVVVLGPSKGPNTPALSASIFCRAKWPRDDLDRSSFDEDGDGTTAAWPKAESEGPRSKRAWVSHRKVIIMTKETMTKSGRLNLVLMALLLSVRGSLLMRLLGTRWRQKRTRTGMRMRISIFLSANKLGYTSPSFV